jgi:hypothetical protein
MEFGEDMHFSSSQSKGRGKDSVKSGILITVTIYEAKL